MGTKQRRKRERCEMKSSKQDNKKLCLQQYQKCCSVCLYCLFWSLCKERDVFFILWEWTQHSHLPELTTWKWKLAEVDDDQGDRLKTTTITILHTIAYQATHCVLTLAPNHQPRLMMHQAISSVLEKNSLKVSVPFAMWFLEKRLVLSSWALDFSGMCSAIFINHALLVVVYQFIFHSAQRQWFLRFWEIVVAF